METIDYGDLIQRPHIIYVCVRPYRETLYKDIYIKVLAKRN